MPKTENNNSSLEIEVVSENPVVVTTDAPIKRIQEKVIWSTEININENKSFKASLVAKETWMYAETLSISDNDAIIEADEAQDGHHTLNLCIAPFFSVSFIRDIWQTIKNDIFLKALPALFIYLCGGMTSVLKYYFALAAFAILTGCAAESKKGKFSFSLLNKHFFNQIYYLFAIIVVNIAINLLRQPDILGNGAMFIREFIICYLGVSNVLATMKYLVLLGVPIPKSWVGKFDAIRTLIE